MANKFTWGDTVIISKNAPACFRPGEIVSICGMTKVESEKLADLYKCNIDDWVYTIEYMGGSDIQIPEKFLEKD